MPPYNQAPKLAETPRLRRGHRNLLPSPLDIESFEGITSSACPIRRSSADSVLSVYMHHSCVAPSQGAFNSTTNHMIDDLRIEEEFSRTRSCDSTFKHEFNTCSRGVSPHTDCSPPPSRLSSSSSQDFQVPPLPSLCSRTSSVVHPPLLPAPPPPGARAASTVL
ncbi:hypothetical protein T484DRAFT_1755781 [Baffinella frigidus]|nr:hypothetical protein T484DRAFT_1755781 [Cryptophyta sp. CCMP2293]